MRHFHPRRPPIELFMNLVPHPVRALLLALAFACPAFGAAAQSAKPAAAASSVKSTTKTAEPRREGALGKGTSTLPPLTMDQLRACLSEQARLKQEASDLVQLQASIEQERGAIERTGAQLDADKATLDASDEAAVNAYNERVRKRTQQIEAFKATAPAFNARVDKITADRKAYADSCADRRFFEEDYEAIKAGK
jgi:hypothetical protein